MKDTGGTSPVSGYYEKETGTFTCKRLMEEVAFLCLYTVTLVGNVQRVCWFHHFSHDGNKITLQILINDVSLWCFTQQSCAVILPLCIALEMEIFTFIGIDKGRKPNEV